VQQTSPQKQRLTYAAVMWCYLVSGILGSLFIAGETLDQTGLAAPLIDFLFGKRAEEVVMFLEAVRMLMTIGLVLLLFVGWIPALIVIVRYRRSWRALLPVGVLLTGCLAAGVSIFLEFASGATGELAMGVAITLYFVAAAAIGVEWLYRGRPATDPG
jgi:hypothetical protein